MLLQNCSFKVGLAFLRVPLLVAAIFMSTVTTVMATDSAPLGVFTVNAGQWPDHIHYRVNTNGATAWLSDGTIYYQTFYSPQLADVDDQRSLPSRFDKPDVLTRLTAISFEGAKATAAECRDEVKNYVCNFYLGGDPSRWEEMVKSYRSVTYRELYPGVDLEISATDGHLVYELIAESVDALASVRIGIEGSGAQVFGPSSEVVVRFAWGEFVMNKLMATRNGGEPVAVAFRIEDNVAHLAIDEQVRRDEPIRVGYELLYSSYLGGSAADISSGLVRTKAAWSSLAFIAGSTYSADFPLAQPWDDALDGPCDAYVAGIEFGNDGVSLTYSTYFGGDGNDDALGLDETGSYAFVTGRLELMDSPFKNMIAIGGGPLEGPSKGADGAFAVFLNTNGQDRLIHCVGPS